MLRHDGTRLSAAALSKSYRSALPSIYIWNGERRTDGGELSEVAISCLRRALPVDWIQLFMDFALGLLTSARQSAINRQLTLHELASREQALIHHLRYRAVWVAAQETACSKREATSGGERFSNGPLLLGFSCRLFSSAVDPFHPSIYTEGLWVVATDPPDYGSGCDRLASWRIECRPENGGLVDARAA